jgi:hypothetical protein
MNLCFDTEFSHIKDPVLPAHAHLPAAQLISIGIAGMHGERFYAENSEVDHSLCSDFVMEEVLQHLEGGAVAMPLLSIGLQLRDWLTTFQEPVTLWSDAPVFDWPFILQLFEETGWPENLVRQPGDLNFRGMIPLHRFKRAQMMAQQDSIPRLRKHHALDDAIAMISGFVAAKSVE